MGIIEYILCLYTHTHMYIHCTHSEGERRRKDWKREWGSKEGGKGRVCIHILKNKINIFKRQKKYNSNCRNTCLEIASDGKKYVFRVKGAKSFSIGPTFERKVEKCHK